MIKKKRILNSEEQKVIINKNSELPTVQIEENTVQKKVQKAVQIKKDTRLN